MATRPIYTADADQIVRTTTGPDGKPVDEVVADFSIDRDVETDPRYAMRRGMRDSMAELMNLLSQLVHNERR